MTSILIFTFGVFSGYLMKSIQTNSDKIMRLYRAISQVEGEIEQKGGSESNTSESNTSESNGSESNTSESNTSESNEPPREGFPIDNAKTQLKRYARIWYKTLITIIKLNFKNLYTRFIQTVKTPHIISHDTYEIEYFYKGKTYRLLLNDTSHASHPSSQSFNVYNENNQEITSRFLEYLGPQFDFHKRGLTPKDLGYKRVVILDENFNEHTYEECEQINVHQ